MSKILRENRKNRRVQLENPLRVVMCSIGAQVRYELWTRNISYNGFYLEHESPGRFPFNQSSIMEVWLELGDAGSVFFNGKMARVVRKGDEPGSELGPGIAIRIVQIDRENEEKLKAFINSKVGELQDNPSSVA